MRNLLLHMTLLFLSSMASYASELACQIGSFEPVSTSLTPVFSKSGNIYYTDSNGHSIKITQTNKDSSPVLSPNKKLIAFIRKSNKIIPESCDIDVKYGSEIWLYDLSTKKEKRLVKNNFECDKPKKQIVDPRDLLFSPDNKTLYFMTAAWTTSGAVHGVYVDNSKERFIIDGNGIEIVLKGDYSGYLIVNQHRYFIGGGSYDWYWLVNPNGKEEGPIGEEVTQDQMNFIES